MSLEGKFIHLNGTAGVMGGQSEDVSSERFEVLPNIFGNVAPWKHLKIGMVIIADHGEDFCTSALFWPHS